jgi:hypothetical protein
MVGPTTEEQSPSPAFGNVQVVTAQGVRFPDRPGLNLEGPIRGHILVMTFENNRYEIAGMVVEKTPVI